MRRTLATMSVIGLLATSLGCHHVAGKCDCQAHPADGALSNPTTPYAVKAVPTALPPAPIPQAGTAAPAK